MAGKTRDRAVACGNYTQLYDYVAAGLNDLEDDKIPLLFEEIEDDADDFNLAGLGDADMLLMETLRGKRF